MVDTMVGCVFIDVLGLLYVACTKGECLRLFNAWIACLVIFKRKHSLNLMIGDYGRICREVQNVVGTKVHLNSLYWSGFHVHLYHWCMVQPHVAFLLTLYI